MGSDLHLDTGGARDLLFSSSDLPPLDDLLFADGTRGLGPPADPTPNVGTDTAAETETAPSSAPEPESGPAAAGPEPIVPKLSLSRPVLADSAGGAAPPGSETVGPGPGELAAKPQHRRRRPRQARRSKGLAVLLGASEPTHSAASDLTRNRRIGVATGMVACVGVLAALLVPTDDRSGVSETAADTPEAAAASASGTARSGLAASGQLEDLLGDDPADAALLGADAIDYELLDQPFMIGSSTAVTTDDADDPDTSASSDGATAVTDDDAATDGSSSTATGSSTTADGSTTSTTAGAETSTQPATTDITATTTASTTCSGVTWTPVLDEQFNGSSLDGSVWEPYDSVGNSGFGLRRPSAISVSGGMLNITAQMIDGVLVSGGVQHVVDQQYGRYEFRVRTDQDLSEATSGVILTWPSSEVHPRDGKNSIYETLATPGDRHEFYTFIHKPFGTVTDQDETVHPISAASFHTMAMEWTPDWIKLYRDGSLVKTIDETSTDLIPDNPHFLAVRLDATKDTVAANTTMQVDWVKVWSYGGGC